MLPLAQAGGGKSRRDEYLRPIEPELRNQKTGLKVWRGVEGTRIDHSIFRTHVFGAMRAELRCRWTSDAVPITNSIVAKKIRWLRKMDTSGSAALEIPLGPDEAPLSGAALPEDTMQSGIDQGGN